MKEAFEKDFGSLTTFLTDIFLSVVWGVYNGFDSGMLFFLILIMAGKIRRLELKD